MQFAPLIYLFTNPLHSPLQQSIAANYFILLKEELYEATTITHIMFLSSPSTEAAEMGKTWFLPQGCLGQIKGWKTILYNSIPRYKLANAQFHT